MATAVFHAKQYLLAALAGASYVAPYIGAIQSEAGDNPWITLENMLQIKRNYNLKAKILGASLTSTDEIISCAKLGLEAITCKEQLFSEWTGNVPVTINRINRFNADWLHAGIAWI